MKRDKTKKGSHTVESTDTRETRSHLPTAPWPYVPYFSPLFNPGTISARVGEERFHEREIATWKGKVTVLLLRSRTKIEAKMEIFYFNWGKNLDWRGALLNCIMEETCIFQRERFFFHKRDSDISNSFSIPRHRFREWNVEFQIQLPSRNTNCAPFYLSIFLEYKETRKKWNRDEKGSPSFRARRTIHTTKNKVTSIIYHWKIILYNR